MVPAESGPGSSPFEAIVHTGDHQMNRNPLSAVDTPGSAGHIRFLSHVIFPVASKWRVSYSHLKECKTEVGECLNHLPWIA